MARTIDPQTEMQIEKMRSNHARSQKLADALNKILVNTIFATPWIIGTLYLGVIAHLIYPSFFSEGNWGAIQTIANALIGAVGAFVIGRLQKQLTEY